MAILPSVLTVYDLETFEEYWEGILYNVPQVGLFDVFS